MTLSVGVRLDFSLAQDRRMW